MNSNFSTLNYNRLDEAQVMLRSISHPSRLKILNLLLKSGELTQSDLCEAFPTFNTNILTKHLKIMFDNDIIEKSKAGKYVKYYANVRKVEKIMNLLKDFTV
jgi:DNA-binding transcriptional ArsR family regulator